MSASDSRGLSRLDQTRAASMADEGGHAGAQLGQIVDLTVYDVMTQPAVVVGPNVALKDAAQTMRDLDVDLLSIEDHDRLVGIVTDRDVAVRVVAAGKNPASTRVREVMTKRVICCHEGDSVLDAACTMRDHALRCLIVLNSSQRVVGVVSLDDLALRESKGRLP
jgi:CBS domain-containing protein